VEFSLKSYALLPFLTLVQGLLFAVLFSLRGRREERYSDFWLALLLIFAALNGVPYMLGWMNYNNLWEKYTYLPWDGFWLAIPPTLYLFLKSLTNQKWRFSFKKDAINYWTYALYFTIHLIIGVVFFGQRDAIWQIDNQYFINIFFQILSWGNQIFYFFVSYRLYKDYRNWTVNEYSNIEQVSFKWFKNFLFIYFFCWFIGFLNSLYIDLFTTETSDNHYALMWLGYLMDTVLLYYISISGFMQSRIKNVVFDRSLLKKTFILEEKDEIDIVPQLNITLPNKENNVILQEEIRKNVLSDADLETWKNKVSSYFEKEKPYIDCELTLSELAIRLKTNTSVLSQVINKGFDKNFNDFINTFRIQEYQAKVKTPQYQHLTILAVALDCGFNSKATFNRAYKKLTGKNPSDF
jgi:AraC-like DNA-binding protein